MFDICFTDYGPTCHLQRLKCGNLFSANTRNHFLPDDQFLAQHLQSERGILVWTFYVSYICAFIFFFKFLIVSFIILCNIYLHSSVGSRSPFVCRLY